MVFYVFATLAILAVAGVLVAGLLNMARGGSPQMSQKLMQWRVGLQFVAIILLMLVLLMVKR